MTGSLSNIRKNRRHKSHLLEDEKSREAQSMNPEHLQLLVTRQMPFGKYKGRLLADLPGDYLAWFAREGFPAGELGGLIALMYELDHNALTHLLAPLRKK
jgi:uncharacterized protein (DUF3820 family)